VPEPGVPSTVPVEVARLQELLGRRDELVQAIAAGVPAGDWERIMGAFDALLVAIQKLEAGVAKPPTPEGLDRRGARQ